MFETSETRCQAFQTFHCFGALRARQITTCAQSNKNHCPFSLELERGLTEEQIRIVCKQMFEVMSMLLC